MTEVIKNIATNNGLVYVFGTYREINHLFDRINDFPAVAELLPLKGTFSLKYGAVTDKTEVVLLFLDRDLKTVNSEATDQIVERMKTAALDFIKALNASGIYEEIDDTSLQYFTIVKQFDKCLSGIELDLTLTPLTSKCL